jgi:hypothetical protein
MPLVEVVHANPLGVGVAVHADVDGSLSIAVRVAAIVCHWD